MLRKLCDNCTLVLDPSDLPGTLSFFHSQQMTYSLLHRENKMHIKSNKMSSVICCNILTWICTKAFFSLSFIKNRNGSVFWDRHYLLSKSISPCSSEGPLAICILSISSTYFQIYPLFLTSTTIIIVQDIVILCLDWKHLGTTC